MGGSQIRPWLTGAANTRSGKATFAESKDQYLAAYFRIDGSTPVTFTRDEVFLRIEEFEFPAIVVSQLDERGWQANFKWPSWIGASLCAVSVIVMGNASNEVTINQNLENVISVESPSSLREATSLSVFQIEFSPIDTHIPGAAARWRGRIVLLDSYGKLLDLSRASVRLNGTPVEIITRGRIDERLWQLSIETDHPSLRGTLDIAIGDGQKISNVPLLVPDGGGV